MWSKYGATWLSPTKESERKRESSVKKKEKRKIIFKFGIFHFNSLELGRVREGGGVQSQHLLKDQTKLNKKQQLKTNKKGGG